jgi:parallel beta-helix repeat protein
VYFEGAEASTDSNVVAYNVVYDHPKGPGFIIRGSYNWIHDNISYGSGIAGIQAYGGTGHGNEYSNNVLYGNGVGILLSGTGANVVRNNVCLNNAQCLNEYIIGTGTVIDYNCYYPGGPYMFYTAAGGYMSFTEYQAFTGQEAHGILADPLCVDTAAHNFRLRDSTSPCFDAGDSATTPGYDLDGVRRPQGAAAEMGVYEHVAAPVVTRAHGALYFTVTPDSHLVVLNSARDTLWKSTNVVPYDSAVVAATAWNAHQLEGRDTTALSVWFHSFHDWYDSTARAKDSVSKAGWAPRPDSVGKSGTSYSLVGGTIDQTARDTSTYAKWLAIRDSLFCIRDSGYAFTALDTGKAAFRLAEKARDTARAALAGPDTVATRAWGGGIWLALAGKAADASGADSADIGVVSRSCTGNAVTADSSKGGATRATLAANATNAYNTDSLIHHSGAKFPRRDTVNAFTAQYYATEVSDSCSSGAATIALATGNVHRVKLNSGANTLTLTGGAAGGRYLLLLKQPTSGAAGTVTFSPVPLWLSATAPTLSTTNSYLDIVTLAYSGIEAKYLGAAALDLR